MVILLDPARSATRSMVKPAIPSRAAAHLQRRLPAVQLGGDGGVHVRVELAQLEVEDVGHGRPLL
ncbi:hypothetical protein [Geodermatophilus maliterrae]|uniref:Uncharacterized protein n=1 Tax=Geodermatophilus maliterrae TaxID=3162531 RepID=A0ABV3XHA8_9ACTN